MDNGYRRPLRRIAARATPRPARVCASLPVSSIIYTGPAVTYFLLALSSDVSGQVAL